MTDLRKAAEIALEALDSCEFDYDNEERQVRTFDAPLVNAAHRALHQALAQPEQEPVDIHCPSCLHSFSIVPVAKRQWVSLTDEQIENFDLPNKPTVKQFVRFVEAALRSKNDPTSN